MAVRFTPFAGADLEEILVRVLHEVMDIPRKFLVQEEAP